MELISQPSLSGEGFDESGAEFNATTGLRQKEISSIFIREERVKRQKVQISNVKVQR